MAIYVILHNLHIEMTSHNHCQTFVYRVTQKMYSCLIKRKMHNKRGIFKIQIVLNYQ